MTMTALHHHTFEATRTTGLVTWLVLAVTENGADSTAPTYAHTHTVSDVLATNRSGES